MPADLEICHFIPVEEFWDEAQDFFEKEKQILTTLLAPTQMKCEHVGGSSIPGSLTKADIDIQIIVQSNDFPKVVKMFEIFAKIKNPENWTEEKAIFKGIDKKFPTDYLVCISGTDAERQYRDARDVLRNNEQLLQQYNDLKRQFEGKTYAEYRPTKRKFWEFVYREKLGIEDVR